MYFIWGAGILFGMIWHGTHLPNCLALYGEAAHPTSNVFDGSIQADRFMACEDMNTASVFGAQAVGIGLMLLIPLLAVGIYHLGGAISRKLRH